MAGTRTRLAAIVSLVCLPVLAGWGGKACMQPSAHCQLPGLTGGPVVAALSDESVGIVVQDNLAPLQDGTIASVCWRGIYIDFYQAADCGPGTVSDSFTITYYRNDPGPAPQPGPLLAGPFPVEPAKLESGVIFSHFGEFVRYEYTAEHPSVPVTAGQCLWLEIKNDTDGVCVWLWETAQGDDLAYQLGRPNQWDVTFCLSAPLGDPAACLGPPCPWDLDGSGGVGTPDLLALLATWGSDPGGPPDFNGDGIVNTADLLILLAAWGPCE